MANKQTELRPTAKVSCSGAQMSQDMISLFLLQQEVTLSFSCVRGLHLCVVDYVWATIKAAQMISKSSFPRSLVSHPSTPIY